MVVTSLFPPAVGGAAVAFPTLAREWAEDESVEEIFFLCERRADSPPREVEGKIVVRRLLPARDSRHKPKGLRHLAFAVGTYALIALWVSWYAHRQDRPVVILHCRYGRGPLIKLLRCLGIKIVAYLSDLHTPPTRLEGCNAVVCVTENVYERAVKELPRTFPAFYIPLAFDRPSPVAGHVLPVEAVDPYLLFIGNVVREKGVDVLLEAFATFRRGHPGHRLLLAGTVRDISLCRGPSEGVVFLGPVGRPEVISLIQHAEAVVLPSRSEGLPRVCLEAISLGTKVICPPEIPELSRVCPGWVLPSVTVQSVLEKLEKAVGTPCNVSFDFGPYEPKVVAGKFLELCQVVRNAKCEAACLRPEIMSGSGHGAD